MNTSRLRELLTFIEGHTGQFDTTVFGEAGRPCGPVADLAGWALMLSGWTLVADNTFKDRDDGREIHRYEDIEREACAILGLTQDEYWDGGDTSPLFALNGDAALRRLRELTEEAEAVRADG